MSAYRVAERYAKALAESVAEDAALVTAQQALSEIAELFESHREFRTLLSNPAIPIEERLRVLDGAITPLKSPAEVASLSRVLLRRGRIRDLSRVAALFADVVDERLGRVTAHVTTATPLQPEQEQRLRQSLEKFAGKTVRIVADVDASIVGGVVARIGQTVVDGSIRSRLERLKRALVAQEI